LWAWFSADSLRDQGNDAVQRDLLKTTYRIERDVMPELYKSADEVAAVLDLNAPVTFYQALAEHKRDIDVNDGSTAGTNLLVGSREQEIVKPVYLPGYICWEHQGFAGLRFKSEKSLSDQSTITPGCSQRDLRDYETQPEPPPTGSVDDSAQPWALPRRSRRF
jgi:hypothetical protein